MFIRVIYLWCLLFVILGLVDYCLISFDLDVVIYGCIALLVCLFCLGVLVLTVFGCLLMTWGFVFDFVCLNVCCRTFELVCFVVYLGFGVCVSVWICIFDVRFGLVYLWCEFVCLIVLWLSLLNVFHYFNFLIL